MKSVSAARYSGSCIDQPPRSVERLTFRATGITDYLTNGGKLEIAGRIAGHANAKTTGLYDRRSEDISVSEVERVRI